LYSATEPPHPFVDVPVRTKSYGGHHFSKEEAHLGSEELAFKKGVKVSPVVLGVALAAVLGLVGLGVTLMSEDENPKQPAQASVLQKDRKESPPALAPKVAQPTPAVGTEAIPAVEKKKSTPEPIKKTPTASKASQPKKPSPRKASKTGRAKPSQGTPQKSSQRQKAVAMTQKGNDLIAQGKTDKGLAQLKRAQRADPSFAEVYRALAAAYKMTGSPKKACGAIKTYLSKKSLSAGRQGRYRKMFCQ
jgi:outer membrane biosynthesis protein TonB